MKTRQELVEVMEAAANKAFSVHRGEPFCGRAMINAALEAIEAAGARVVPVVATDEMEKAAQSVLYDAVGYIDYGGWTGVSRDQDEDSGQQVLTAMLNATPFKGE